MSVSEQQANPNLRTRKIELESVKIDNLLALFTKCSREQNQFTAVAFTIIIRSDRNCFGLWQYYKKNHKSLVCCAIKTRPWERLNSWMRLKRRCEEQELAEDKVLLSRIQSLAARTVW